MKFSVDDILRPCVRGIEPYSPGRPIEEVKREYGLSDVVKMASNENLLGPSPLALEALGREMSGINFYPDGSARRLKEAIGARLGVEPGQVIAGNGSDEIIRIIAETFLCEGEEAVISDPSFVVYATAVRVAGGRCRVVPLKNFSYDVDSLLGAVGEKTKIVFFANPNNPTGTMLSREQADRFMERIPRRVITVFDEAYYEYVESPDFPASLGYLEKGMPVVCLRTFSKIYGLAGLRIGYGITRQDMVSEMNRVRQPFNVNSLAQAAAAAALEDSRHLEKSRKLNSEGKRYLYAELDRLGIEYIPTQANFILVRTGRASSVSRRLLRGGIIVRGMAGYNLGDCLRVTIGLKHHNERFVNALRESLEEEE